LNAAWRAGFALNPPPLPAGGVNYVLLKQYLDMLGLQPLPEKTPLNATVTGADPDKLLGFDVRPPSVDTR